MKDNFLQHIPESFKEQREIIESAFGILASVQEKAAGIRSDLRLSDLGRSELLAELMKGGFGEHMGQLKARSQNLHADIENRKQNLRLPPVDKTDRYGQEQRRQILDFIRSQPLGERLRVAMATREAMDAVLNAPLPIMSGLSDAQIDTVRKAAEQAAFGPQHAQFAEEDRQMAVLEDAFTLVDGLISKETGTVVDNAPAVITREQLDAMDPQTAMATMKAVSEGRTKLEDGAP
ncbi:hypothetical protein [Bradyrhizobium sp. Tv2a-2]|uniref:hypothetical protein n=1 Tax=Bradyrhizobium sp. Tv2a-2 TaxID=113395 RepID=UPI000421220D|nr:hypothetical protein [Bradyrhizobium sp. Tv2a-2]